jgi:N-acyl-phosphatidylethanolamine-hydrolysing phospholipase D
MKPAHHRPDGFVNSNPDISIGKFPWYEMVWRSLRGEFQPLKKPEGGYARFAREWQTPVNHALLSQRHQSPHITWLGHVSMLLQVNQLNILIDPTLADFAGPMGRVGAPRRIPVPLQPEQLPAIDAVLISHNHYDHLCDATIERLLKSGQKPQFFAPLGLKPWFQKRKIQVTELDWWQQHDLGPQLRLHFTPAQHWSRRTPWDTNTSLWGGYMVEWLRPRAQPPWRFLFPGDTGYSDDFKTIRQRIGKVDFLAMPIGAYLPRHFMKKMHVDPSDAVQMMLDLEAQQGMGVHWGTFRLSQESFDQPPRDLAAALRQRNISQEAVWLLKHGETRAIKI